jgi:hypothetical protein
MMHEGLIYSRYRGNQPANAERFQAEDHVPQHFSRIQVQRGLESLSAQLQVGTIKVGCDGDKISQWLIGDPRIVSLASLFSIMKGTIIKLHNSC